MEFAAGEPKVLTLPRCIARGRPRQLPGAAQGPRGSSYETPQTPIEASEVEDYFASMQRRNKPLLREFHKHIGISSGGKTWGVQLGKLAEDFVIEGEEPYDPEYVLTMSPRILRAILSGETGWEEALLSMRIDLHRKPDVFDLTFMSLLRDGNEPAQTQQIMRERRNTETIERDRLKIQRLQAKNWPTSPSPTASRNVRGITGSGTSTPGDASEAGLAVEYRVHRKMREGSRPTSGVFLRLTRQCRPRPAAPRRRRNGICFRQRWTIIDGACRRLPSCTIHAGSTSSAGQCPEDCPKYEYEGCQGGEQTAEPLVGVRIVAHDQIID
ncbi:hypothetical protein [Mycoplana rhizolycopersici]|uniref:Uncharacterized protein n=1 Tax=Mycoplana rhizolycopersici TaxID=2746702 RepID=A0ABX2QCY3_9HYPH|nr:hypothetical protein [Rhizobium rhizolycopersici]NVP55582.1 hypothetical protein [Rhizobium rhizolycopersici]